MITLENINKSYKTAEGELTALSNVNLHVNPGEIFGIIGQSGAGKSTLIRCVNLLEKPNNGRIIVAGEDLLTLSMPKLRIARRNMGMIFQHFNLLSSRNVYDNVALPLELSGFPKKKIAEWILPLLELTGLHHKQKAYPAQLSGGQKQRVAIARALACRPKILLSDEATSSLDPETTLSILHLLKNIRDRFNLTILLITHEMDVIKACCDKVAILQKGRLIEENEVGEFFVHPKTQIAKNFIASSVLHHLPEAIEKYVLDVPMHDTHPILRLWFLYGTATQPVISELSQQFDLKINILQANVEYIKKHAMGLMIVVVRGNQLNIQPAIQYLHRMNIEVEIIGYVPDNIISII